MGKFLKSISNLLISKNYAIWQYLLLKISQVNISNLKKSENYIFIGEISLLITGMSIQRNLFIYLFFIYFLLFLYIDIVNQ